MQHTNTDKLKKTHNKQIQTHKNILQHNTETNKNIRTHQHI